MTKRLMVPFKEDVRNKLKEFSEHNGLTESQAVNMIVKNHFNGVIEKQTERKINFQTLLLYANTFVVLMILFRGI